MREWTAQGRWRCGRFWLIPQLQWAATSSSSPVTTARILRTTSSPSTSVSPNYPLPRLSPPPLTAPSPRAPAVTLSWEHKPTYGLPPSPRGYHSAVLADSRLLVCGGFEGSGVFEEVWCLDLGGNSFLPQITNWAIVLPEDEEEGEGGGAEGR